MPSLTKSAPMPGKFFASHWRGVSYGPFAPDSSRKMDVDFAHIARLGFNSVRLYEIPDQDMLDAAMKHGIKLVCGIPWAEHIDFLSDVSTWQDIRRSVENGAAFLGRQEAVSAILVGNEIEKTLVRWMRPNRVRAAMEELIDVVRAQAPQKLVSYATYPSTEYLVPRNADFLAVNVYLERREEFTRYLARLQNLAGNKPLVITEFGLDTAMQGDEVQREVFQWYETETLAGGCAGAFWFSYTDEWFRGGEEVTAWRFGLVTRERQERAACQIMPARLSPPSNAPRISVVVCTRNGARTLSECLESLKALNYPHYEVWLVDDGSTDATPEIAKSFHFVKYYRQEPAGLSVARNRGAELATGSIVAYTDDDCIAHADWLLYLSLAFADEHVLAAGGPNIPPPPRNRVERVVAAAPGAPAHVLLSDTEAEHLPGCNLAIRKVALHAIGGFKADFITAGDDVDICWRLREHGGRGSLRFVPGAMVWHHRRFTIRAYLRQQLGYGRAEALLMRQHPQRFGPLGGARWRGGIYGDHLPSDDPIEGSIYHGPLGMGAFQTIYAANKGFRWWDRFTGVIWIAFALLAAVLRLEPVALLLLVFASWAAWRISRRNAQAVCLGGLRDGTLLWLLSFLQPVVREFARLSGMFIGGARPTWRPHAPDILPPLKPGKISITLTTLSFWSEEGHDRHCLLNALRHVLTENRRMVREDDGWRWFDFELAPHSDLSQAFMTVTEYHGHRRCLTRVRCMLRIRRGLVWNLALGLVLACLLATLPLPIGFFGVIGVVGILIGIPLALRFIRLDMKSMLHQAAVQAGMPEATKRPA